MGHPPLQHNIVIIIYMMFAMALAHKASGYQWATTIMLMIIATMFIPVYIMSMGEFYPGQAITEISFDETSVFMSDMGPIFRSIRLLEWTLVMAVMIWVIQTSMHYRKHA